MRHAYARESGIWRWWELLRAVWPRALIPPWAGSGKALSRAVQGGRRRSSDRLPVGVGRDRDWLAHLLQARTRKLRVSDERRTHRGLQERKRA